jgi:hypothetical protein
MMARWSDRLLRQTSRLNRRREITAVFCGDVPRRARCRLRLLPADGDGRLRAPRTDRS